MRASGWGVRIRHASRCASHNICYISCFRRQQRHGDGTRARHTCLSYRLPHAVSAAWLTRGRPSNLLADAYLPATGKTFLGSSPHHRLSTTLYLHTHHHAHTCTSCPTSLPTAPLLWTVPWHNLPCLPYNPVTSWHPVCTLSPVLERAAMAA